MDLARTLLEQPLAAVPWASALWWHMGRFMPAASTPGASCQRPQRRVPHARGHIPGATHRLHFAPGLVSGRMHFAFAAAQAAQAAPHLAVGNLPPFLELSAIVHVAAWLFS
ncbi:hypothetical protein CDD82_425 [Ophiocordyceps australis]|uniref:Uncharacterized protein n=1 Tax=Ophiocordyceps australis TaxID=1399860 RepID=A0A2C5XRQ7_9HYPO|nr:hypothetical protein CDD82_425 [Ophiocordyceps australis]